MSVLESYQNLEKRVASISKSGEEKLLFIATNDVGPESGQNRLHFAPGLRMTAFWFLGPQGIRKMLVSLFGKFLPV